MEKFLEIYNDTDDNYVLVSVNRIKFIRKISVTQTVIFFNANNSNEDVLAINHDSTSDFVVKNALIEAVGKIVEEPYTESSIKVNLPVSVSEIKFI